MRLPTIVVTLFFSGILAGIVARGGEPNDLPNQAPQSERGGLKDGDAVVVDIDEKYEPVDWSVTFPPSGKITKVVVVLHEMEPYPGGIKESKWLNYETKNELVLQTIQTGLKLPLRLGIPDEAGWHAGPAINLSVGHIEIFMDDKSSFIVGMTWTGFALGEKEYRAQNVFFSWALAKQVDDLMFQENKKHLPKWLFDNLSGEAEVRSSKHKYYLLRKKLQNEDSERP